MISVTLREKKGKKGIRLYLDCYVNGKRSWIFLKNLPLLKYDKDIETANYNKQIKLIAEKVRLDREVELTSGQTKILPNYLQNIKLSDYIEKYIKLTKSHKCSLKHFVEYDNEVLIKNIDTQWVVDFQEYLINKNIKNNSIRLYITNLKTVLKKAINAKILKDNPFINFKLVKPNEVERTHIERADIEKIFNVNIPEHLEETRQAFIFACFTGLRFSDLQQIQANDIKSNTLVFIQAKTNFRNEIPLDNPTVMDIIKDRKSGYLFKLKNYQTELINLNKILKLAGVNKKIGFHAARHYTAIELHSKGIDIYTISKFLGHKNIGTTQKYFLGYDLELNNRRCITSFEPISKTNFSEEKR